MTARNLWFVIAWIMFKDQGSSKLEIYNEISQILFLRAWAVANIHKCLKIFTNICKYSQILFLRA